MQSVQNEKTQFSSSILQIPFVEFLADSWQKFSKRFFKGTFIIFHTLCIDLICKWTPKKDKNKPAQIHFQNGFFILNFLLTFLNNIWASSLRKSRISVPKWQLFVNWLQSYLNSSESHKVHFTPKKIFVYFTQEIFHCAFYQKNWELCTSSTVRLNCYRVS